jgi:3-deoxy-D-manno-octulosonate 8-phosphate phosphatase (KDO 8-P phosphatase)
MIPAAAGWQAGQYIGDDANDLRSREVGRFTAAPFDTPESVASAVGLSAGGEGAFREFAEWILRLRGAGTRDHDKGEVA